MGMSTTRLSIAIGGLLVVACQFACKNETKDETKEQRPTANVTATVTATPKPSAVDPSAVELVLHTSLGPLKLGTPKDDVEKLGLLKVHPKYSGMTIPYNVYYDAAGKASRIETSLKYSPSDVRVGTATILRTMGFEDVKKLLGDCVDDPPADGGTTSKCRGGSLWVQIGSGSIDEVWISVVA